MFVDFLRDASIARPAGPSLCCIGDLVGQIDLTAAAAACLPHLDEAPLALLQDNVSFTLLLDG